MSLSRGTKQTAVLPRPASSIRGILATAHNAYLAGRLDEARQLCLQALALDVRHVGALHLLGRTEFQAGRPEVGEKMLRRALAADETNADVLANLGLILQSRGRLDEAAQCYLQTLKIKPEQIEARNNLGCIYRKLDRMEEAVACFRKVLELEPDHLQAIDNLGAVLMHMGALDEAMRCCQRALKLDPGNMQVHSHMAIVLQYQGRYEDSLAYLDKVYAEIPEPENVQRQTAAQVEVKWNRAMMQLATGHFAEGWKSYEWRWWTEFWDTPHRRYAQPLWQGERLEGRLLLWPEQGVGDEVQFVGLLPEVLRTGNRILLECAPRLVPLFARSFPEVEVVAQPAVTAATEFAAHLPVGSLPGLFRSSEEDFRQSLRGYLRADPAAVEALRARYDNGRRRVGLAWYTGNKSSGAKRSIALARFQPFFAQPDLHWISLQYGDFDALEKQAAEAGAPLTIDRAVDQMADLDLFAAQIAALDLVITIDNSTAHMAAALGRPVWLLLPLDCDCRWLRRRSDCPWYPTMRIFRQSKPGDWNPVLDAVNQELAQWIRKGVENE